MNDWFEIYRGGVMPWDCDTTEHLTMASYYERSGDAYLAFLDSIDMGEGYRREHRCGMAAVEDQARFTQELRSGDVMHIVGGILGVDDKVVHFGQQVINSATGEVTAAFQQRTVHFDLDRRKAVSIPAAQKEALLAQRVEWDGPPRTVRFMPDGLAGFVATARDTVKPWEIDVIGHLSAHFYVVRFSMASMQALASIGFTSDYARNHKRGASTFEMDLRFYRELNVGDAVSVHSAITDIGDTSFRLVHKLVNERSGEIAASMSQYGVHLDMQTRRPTPFPDDIKAKAAGMLIVDQ